MRDSVISYQNLLHIIVLVVVECHLIGSESFVMAKRYLVQTRSHAGLRKSVRVRE